MQKQIVSLRNQAESAKNAQLVKSTGKELTKVTTTKEVTRTKSKGCCGKEKCSIM